MLSSIRIGDGALTTDALQLPSLDGREATAGEDRTAVRDSRRRRAANRGQDSKQEYLS